MKNKKSNKISLEKMEAWSDNTTTTADWSIYPTHTYPDLNGGNGTNIGGEDLRMPLI